MKLKKTHTVATLFRCVLLRIQRVESAFYDALARRKLLVQNLSINKRNQTRYKLQVLSKLLVCIT